MENILKKAPDPRNITSAPGAAASKLEKTKVPGLSSPPTGLRCEYSQNPLGLDVARPRLSWLVNDSRRGAMQTAFQLIVSSSLEKAREGHADFWDSGRILSDRSIHIVYEGVALNSGQRAYWTVRNWTVAPEGGEVPGEFAAPAWWEMGLLSKKDWKARWVGSPLMGSPDAATASPLLRKVFHIQKPLSKARLYVTALGLYEARINGQKVGADVLTPGWTDYRKRVKYQVYDVASLLTAKENVLGAILGDGWYCGTVAWLNRQCYGASPKLLAQLVLDYEDGSRETIVTDETWKWTLSPVISSDLVHGETYDARREVTGWDSPRFDDTKWFSVDISEDPGIERAATIGASVTKQNELKALSVKKVAGRWIIDLGQNMVGWVRLKMKLPKGRTVTLRHGEALDAEGKLYTANLRRARATDRYTAKGDENGEIWEPQFTFHGFRYVEVHGHDEELPIDAITGIVIHTDMEQTGSFECSDSLINQLQHNIVWGQKGNYLEVPTDCPQRDERLGWTGDAQVFIRTGAFNFNVAPFFTKWQQDLADAQSENGNIPAYIPQPPVEPVPGGPTWNTGDGGPAWADAMVICPWTIYLCYGDNRLLASHYDSLKRWVDSLEAGSKNLIRAYPGAKWEGFGDWLAMDGSNTVFARTASSLIGTAFYAKVTEILGKIAGLLGKMEDAQVYSKLHEKIRAAFVNRFVTPEGLIYSDTQTSYVLALEFNLLPEELRAPALAELTRMIVKNGNKLATGFVGTSYLNHVLANNGSLELAYKLLLQKEYPSWLYSVTQGATTIWERWNGWTHDKGFEDPGMNSFNHYAYGAIGEWLYSVVAGIELDPEKPAYKHIIIRPRQGGGLTHAKATLKSPHGLIESGWRMEGNKFTLNVKIPPNASATIYVPGKTLGAITESGKKIGEGEGRCGEAFVFRVGAGKYEFESKL